MNKDSARDEVSSIRSESQDRLSNIFEELGLIEAYENHQRILEVLDNIQSEKEFLKDYTYTAISDMCPHERKSYNSCNYTIRDGSVYKYKRSQELGFRTFLSLLGETDPIYNYDDNLSNYLNFLYDNKKELQEVFKSDVFSYVQANDIPKEWRLWKRNKYEPRDEYDYYLIHKASEPITLGIPFTCTYCRREMRVLRNTGGSTFRYNPPNDMDSIEWGNIIRTIEHSDYISKVVDKSLEKVESHSRLVNEVVNKFNEELSPYFVSSEL